MFEALLQDVRYATRMLRRSPLFTTTAALSLAIGIGANATIFSMVNALLFRPLPGLANADRLVDVGRTQNGRGFDTVSFPNYRDLRERTKSLQGLYAARLAQPMSLGSHGEAERIYGNVVTANYFSVLGTRPALGRLLQDTDDRADSGGAVVVMSYELWQRRFGGDPDIVGATISVNGHPFTVIGITPIGFHGTTALKADVWVPMSMLAEAVPRMNTAIFNERASVWLFMGGRLADGVTVAQANAELQTLGAALEREHPSENRGKSYTVLKSGLVPGDMEVVAGFLAPLMAIVGLVLLIACVNVAGMLLARAVARRREIAVRLAIGAGRGRLIRQLLTETAILFIAGGVAGIVLTKWLTALLLAIIPKLPVPVGIEIATDWRVLVFAALLSLTAALVSGLAPVLQASRADVVPALKTEGLDGGLSRLRLRNAFVVGQVTMSLMLVVTAGLFLRALQHAYIQLCLCVSVSGVGSEKASFVDSGPANASYRPSFDVHEGAIFGCVSVSRCQGGGSEKASYVDSGPR